MDNLLFFVVAPLLVGVLFFPVVIAIIRRVRGARDFDRTHEDWRD